MTAPTPQTVAAINRLRLGLATTLAFLLLAAVLGTVTPAFDARHQAISAISLGPLGWIQNASFALLGLVLLGTVPAWRQLLHPGPAANAYPVLTAVVGACFLLFAVVPQDPAPGYDPANLHLERPTPIGLLHLALAGIAPLAQIGGLLLLARRFASNPEWRTWAPYTATVAILMVGCITIYGVWSVQPTGWGGTFERLAVLLPALWAWTFLRRLARGAPAP